MKAILETLGRWFSWSNKPARKARTNSLRTRLQVEVLEGRVVPSLTPVSTTGAEPFSGIVSIVAHYDDGPGTGWGTGAFIDATHILTAAHVIYNLKANHNQHFPDSIDILVGRNGKDLSYDNHVYHATYASIPRLYNGTYGNSDVAVLTLDPNDKVPVHYSFGVTNNADRLDYNTLQLYSLGYPGDKTYFPDNPSMAGKLMFQTAGFASYIDTSTDWLNHTPLVTWHNNPLDRNPNGLSLYIHGQSGSPLFGRDSNGHYDIVGVFILAKNQKDSNGQSVIGKSGLELGDPNGQGWATAMTETMSNLVWKMAGEGSAQVSKHRVSVPGATQAATTTSLSADGSIRRAGSQVIFWAEVFTADRAPVDGVVKFYDGNAYLGEATLSNGMATLFSSTLTVGTHSITAKYQGSDKFQASSSPAWTETILSNQTATTTMLAVSMSSILAHQPVSFSVGVLPFVSAWPTGTVTYFDGATVLGTADVKAQFTTADLGVGSHVITARYNGDANYQASISASVTATVTAPPVQSTRRDGLLARDSATGLWWVVQSNGWSFAATPWAAWSPGFTWVDVQTGDFNGDGLDDILGRAKETGQWFVGLNDGAGHFATSLWATWSPRATLVDVHVSDSNGDGKTDLVARVKETGQWYVGLSTGSGFATQLWATWSTAVTLVDVNIGDFNHDGRADVVARVKETGQWYVGLSTSAGFATQLWTTWSARVTLVDVNVGDFNGDGRTDIIGRVKESGQWYAGLSTGSSFATVLWATWYPDDAGRTWVDVRVGDFNGDGKTDLVGRIRETGAWYLSVSGGMTSSNTSVWDSWRRDLNWVDVQVGDFDGDGKSDLAGRVAGTGEWWTALSNGSKFSTWMWSNWSNAAAWVDVRRGTFS